MKRHFKIAGVEDYEQYMGAEAVERIIWKARPLLDFHIANVNSTYYAAALPRYSLQRPSS